MIPFIKKNNLHILNKKTPTIKNYFTTIRAIQKMRLVKQYIQQSKIERNVNSFIENKVKEKHATTIVFPEKKSLLIMACHPDSLLKFETIIKNFSYFQRFSQNIDIVVISSLDTIYINNVKNAIGDKCFRHFEIANSPSYDFGKWIHSLENLDYSTYNNIIFTNDSYVIHNNIDFFLYNCAKTEVELYGYNDSTQNGYHYQSYLFSVKVDAINKLLQMYYSEINNIFSQEDVIRRFELRMLLFFSSKDCYLKIGELFVNRNKNIFFTSDYLYHKLRFSGLLPFTKIKRII